MREPLIVISGPTASGKSALAVKLAKSLSMEVINSDSVQMYRGCNIGSAKPSEAEMEGVLHHLFDVFSPNEKNSAMKFLQAAEEKLSSRRAIVCGGTMLYLKALLDGLSEMPSTDNALREKLENLSNDDLFNELKKVDPESKLHPNDRVRIIRALEGTYLSDLPASSIQAKHQFNKPIRDALIVLVNYPRDLLYQRINQRTEIMLKNGIIEEVKEIINQFGENAAVLETVGYKEVLMFLKGEIPESELAEAISKSTRNLAKRQLTFWRNEPAKRGWNVLPLPYEMIELGAEGEEGKRAKRKGILSYRMDFPALKTVIESYLKEPQTGISFLPIDGCM